MASTEQNADVRAGDTLTLQFTVTENGVPLDMTGGTLTWTALFNTPLVKTNDDMDLTDIATGIVLLTLEETETRVPEGSYTHALQLELNSTIEHVSIGTITVFPELVT